MAGNVSYGSLPFSEQLAFFRRKFNTKTDAWTDVYGSAHDNEFMVAGANRDALLADLRTAVEKGLSGGTLETFRKDFSAIVARYGWSYNGGFEWRSRVIYETNLRSSYMAGRYQQLMAMRDTHPYWEYVHSDIVEHPRKEHLAWDGMVLRADDPWWIYHFPVNAWGCQCSVIARTEDDLRRMGKDGPDTAPPIRFIAREIGQRSPGGPRTVIVPEGIDPGFEHTPGRSRVFSEVPPPRGGNPVGDVPFTPVADAPARPAPLPAPHPAPAPEETTDPVDAFLHRLHHFFVGVRSGVGVGGLPQGFLNLARHPLVILRPQRLLHAQRRLTQQAEQPHVVGGDDALPNLLLNSFASPMRLWCGSPLVVSGEFRFLGNPCPGAGQRLDG